MELHELVSSLKSLEKELGRRPTSREFIASGVPAGTLNKIKYSELCKMAGETPDEEVGREPRILYFDCEISHMVVKTYQLKVDYIPHSNIIKPWHFLSYAGVFEHDMERDFYLDQRFAEDKSDDRQLIEGLHELISSADILVGHNIERFDIKKFNTRAALYGLLPIRKLIVIDTLKLFRKHFDLPSYSLGYICQYFNLAPKMEHSKDMWDRCLAGDISAWEENELYNKQDNRAARAAFWFVSRYEQKVNFQSIFGRMKCICGETNREDAGEEFTKQGRFQALRCVKCGKIHTRKENLVDKDTRKDFAK